MHMFCYLYCIVSIHLYSASCSARKSEALTCSCHDKSGWWVDCNKPPVHDIAKSFGKTKNFFYIGPDYLINFSDTDCQNGQLIGTVLRLA